MSEPTMKQGAAHLFRVRDPQTGRLYWIACSDDGEQEARGQTKVRAVDNLRAAYDVVSYTVACSTPAKPSEVREEIIAIRGAAALRAMRARHGNDDGHYTDYPAGGNRA